MGFSRVGEGEPVHLMESWTLSHLQRLGAKQEKPLARGLKVAIRMKNFKIFIFFSIEFLI